MMKNAVCMIYVCMFLYNQLPVQLRSDRQLLQQKVTSVARGKLQSKLEQNEITNLTIHSLFFFLNNFFFFFFVLIENIIQKLLLIRGNDLAHSCRQYRLLWRNGSNGFNFHQEQTIDLTLDPSRQFICKQGNGLVAANKEWRPPHCPVTIIKVLDSVFFFWGFNISISIFIILVVGFSVTTFFKQCVYKRFHI